MPKPDSVEREVFWFPRTGAKEKYRKFRGEKGFFPKEKRWRPVCQYQCQCGHVNGGYDADNLDAMRRHQKSFDCPIYRDRLVKQGIGRLVHCRDLCYSACCDGVLLVSSPCNLYYLSCFSGSFFPIPNFFAYFLRYPFFCRSRESHLAIARRGDLLIGLLMHSFVSGGNLGERKAFSFNDCP